MGEKLGQNFLSDESIAQKIVESANLSGGDLVLEIGPGKGILTEKLAKKAKQVVAIEIDKNLAKRLRNKFSNQKNIEIIENDILQIDLKKLKTKYNVPEREYKIIANIPYYITSKIIRLFLESDFPPQEMILMVQKEVAQRIIATLGKMSLLSVSVQYFSQPKMLFEVSRNFFSPIPKVDSAVISIKTKSKQPDKKTTKHFFRVVRTGFSSRRKTLLNNLSSGFNIEKYKLLNILEDLNFSKNTRAQELSIEEWKILAKKL